MLPNSDIHSSCEEKLFYLKVGLGLLAVFLLVMAYGNDHIIGAFLALVGGIVTILVQENLKSKKEKEKSAVIVSLLKSELEEVNGMILRHEDCIESYLQRPFFYDGANGLDIFFSLSSSKESLKDIDAEVLLRISKAYYNARLFFYNLELLSKYYELYSERKSETEAFRAEHGTNEVVPYFDNPNNAKHHGSLYSRELSARNTMRNQKETVQWRLEEFKKAYQYVLDMK